MCNKAVNKCLFVFDSIRDQYKTQEMCDTVASHDSTLIVYCPDKYITQKMYDEAVDEDPFLIIYCPDKYIYSLAVLILIPDWIVTSKRIKKPFTALYADDYICYFEEDSGDVIFNCSEIGIPNISLDNKFDEVDPDSIILMRLFAWYIKFKKELKKVK